MNKKLLPLLFIFAALFQSCEGPKGDPGPEGSAIDVTGTTFDLVDADFTAANEFQVSLSFAAAKVTVLESDAVLVYIHWNNVDSGGQSLKAYRPLPQTAFLDKGILTYNFDRTKNDFSIFLDGTVNLNTLADDWTKDQEFRVIIIPADFAARTIGTLDYNDYNAVVKALNIDDSKVRKVSLQ